MEGGLVQPDGDLEGAWDGIAGEAVGGLQKLGQGTNLAQAELAIMIAIEQVEQAFPLVADQYRGDARYRLGLRRLHFVQVSRKLFLLDLAVAVLVEKIE